MAAIPTPEAVGAAPGTVGAAVEGCAGEVAAALRRAGTIAGLRGALRAAVGRVVEAVGHAELGVGREQQRQPGGLRRVDVLFPAALPPHAAQAGVVVREE